jgi:hypothetical protein
MRKWLSVGLVLVAGLSSALGADDNDRKKWWGLSVGVFLPSSGEIQDRFDDVFFRVGISPFEDRISDRWKFAVDFNALFANKNGNRLFVAPVTVGFARSFGSPEARSIPFVQFGVGPAYYDYSIARGSGRVSTRRVGGNANVEAGILFDRRFALTGRADFYTKTDDFDFSGFSVTLAYAAFRW